MSSLTLKEQYFELSLRSLDRVLSPSPHAYICPICIEPFSDINLLSREHVPPESAGGKMICLTCKPCNSRAGHSIDYAMSLESSFNNLGAVGNAPYRIKLQYQDHSLNAKLERGLDGMKIEILPKLNNPSATKSV